MHLGAIHYFAHDINHLERFSRCCLREAKWEGRGFTGCGNTLDSYQGIASAMPKAVQN